MSRKFESRWKRILGLILESEHVEKYLIPEDPFIEAKKDDENSGRVIAYCEEIEYIIDGLTYIISADFHYKYENNKDRVKIPCVLWVDPGASEEDLRKIECLLQRCINKLGNQFRSEMEQIL